MAGRISRETIDSVGNMTDIVSVIGEYTKLERRGSDFWGCCPFHNEKTPSFKVDPDRKLYYCFGCHAGGGTIKFVQEMEKISFAEAVKHLAKRSGIEISYDDSGYTEPAENKEREEFIDLYDRTANMFHYMLTETEKGKKALSYIKGRGISDETIRTFKLGYSPADRKWLFAFLRGKNFSADFLGRSGLFSQKYKETAFFSNRLMFPIFDRRGQVVAFGGRLLEGDGPKYLNSGDLAHYKKGETLYAFNFAKAAIREKKSVVLCEGYMDVIAYHQCGIKNAVAPLGTALTENQLRVIRGFADTVLLSFDSDGAGQAATKRAILMCRKQNFTVKVIRLSGGKDPAEIMVNLGAGILTNDVDNAILDSEFLLSKLGEEYAVDTPEGKTKASLEFFSYIDSLQSDIQKESCLELLCQAFNLKPEAVQRDFRNREEARGRLRIRQQIAENDSAQEIKLNAELRAVMSVIANLDKFPVMHAELTENDFDDPVAKKLFVVLEECYASNELTENNILERSGNDEIRRLVARVISTGEFSENNAKAVMDSVALVKRNSLEKKRDALMAQISRLKPTTDECRMQLEALLAEKMDLDKRLLKR